MKKLFVIFIAIVLSMFLLSFCTSAASESDLTFAFSVTENNSYMVSYCNSSAQGSLSIPAKYNGKPVTAIAQSAFKDCTGLTSITIPDSVTSIGDYAFSDCTSLTSIEIPDSVTSIGESAFSECTSLTNITLSDSLSVIEINSFYRCTSLTNIIIPDSVIIIYDWAFAGCDSLTSVEIPEGVRTIYERAFFGCDSLTSVKISESVLFIGADAFGDCPMLENIIVDTDNKYYSNDEYGVLFNKDKTRLIKCPPKKNISSYTIPDGVTSIDNFAFRWCSYLTNVTIPDGITSIGERTFSICQYLESITIPGSVESIGSHAFADSMLLSDLYFGGTRAQWNKIKIDTGNDSLLDITLHCQKSDPPVEITSVHIEGVPVPQCGQKVMDYYQLLMENSKLKVYGKSSGNLIEPDGGITYGLGLCKGYDGTKFPEFVSNDAVITNGKYSLYFQLTIADDCVLSDEYIVYINGEQNATVADWVDGLTEVFADFYIVCTHNYDGDCDTVCNYCGETRKASDHKGGTATCKAKAKCSVCGEAYGTFNSSNHRNITTLKSVSATCTKEGKTEGKKCADCGKVTLAQKTVAKKAHTYKTITTKATLKKNGKIENKCTVCGNVKSTTTVYYPKTIKLSKTAYTYNGKVQTPSVTVKDSKGNTLKKDTDYILSYEKGRKATGKYTVTITFKGKYSGTKKLTYTIAPKAVSKINAVQSAKAIKLTWSKVTGADGYRVYQYNAKTKKWVKIKTLKGTSFKVEKLKAGTSYKFRVKAYKNDDGVIWGAAKGITTATKPAASKITKLTTAKTKATLVWSDVAGENGYEVYASTKKDSGFKKVATTKADVKKTTVSKLKSGKIYYFKVRAYKTVGDTKLYSSWSAVKSVKIK